MKNFKKIASAIAALSLAACVAVPMSATVFTASAAGSITITSGDNDQGTHTYDAYQIFTGTLSADGVLTEIEWGTGVNQGSDGGEALIKAIQGITTSSGTPFKDVKNASDVAAVLSEAAENNEGSDVDMEITKKFAEEIAKHLTSVKKTSGAGGKISDLSDGYYLVQDASKPTASTGTNSGAMTRYILEVVGNTNVPVTAKASAPSVEKKVLEDDKITGLDEAKYGTGYNDVADYDIGQTIKFRLYGTLPSTYSDYEHYYYSFNDTYAKTLNTVDSTDDNDENVDVKVYVVQPKAEGGWDWDNAFTVDSSGYNITETAPAGESATGTFSVTFNDLRAIKKDGAEVVNKDSMIVVEYEAQLTSDAIIGLNGQENKVDLEYSNNPNNVGNGESKPGDTGKTPEDKVIVFTYELDVTKYLGEGTNNPANGTDTKEKAEFKLYNSGKTEVAEFDENGKFTQWVTAGGSAGTSLVPDENGLFKMSGIDDGTYVLEETTAPSGYNKMEDLTVIVKATTVNGQTWAGEASEALTALKLYHDTESTESEVANACSDPNLGIVKDEIHNMKGATLPSTGGIGTTLFYLGGGALVAVAGVMLITKKRMTKE